MMDDVEKCKKRCTSNTHDLNSHRKTTRCYVEGPSSVAFAHIKTMGCKNVHENDKASRIWIWKHKSGMVVGEVKLKAKEEKFDK